MERGEGPSDSGRTVLFSVGTDRPARRRSAALDSPDHSRPFVGPTRTRMACRPNRVGVCAPVYQLYTPITFLLTGSSASPAFSSGSQETCTRSVCPYCFPPCSVPRAPRSTSHTPGPGPCFKLVLPSQPPLTRRQRRFAPHPHSIGHGIAASGSRASPGRAPLSLCTPCREKRTASLCTPCRGPAGPDLVRPSSLAESLLAASGHGWLLSRADSGAAEPTVRSP
jgi:hypothetical protein